MSLRRLLALSAVMALAVTAAACGGGDDDDAAPEAETTTSSTTAAAPTVTWPLTGLSAEGVDPLVVNRPAIFVKIDNAEEARPQVGINQADIVYEERVEGITRLAAVFQSTDSEPVGPVRSARSSDIDIVSSYNRPLFLWGGANNGVAAQVAGAALESRNVDSAAVTDKYRDDQRNAPHNLFITSTVAFWTNVGGAGFAPPQFPFRAPDDPPVPGALPTPGYTVDYSGVTADFVWDPARAGWVRFQNGTPHVDAAGVAVAPQNVLILGTPYASSPADPRSPDAQTVGEGDAVVLLGDGSATAARWSRPTALVPVVLTTADGTVIELTPGRTWVLLPEPGMYTGLDATRAAELLATAPPAPAPAPAPEATTETTAAP